MGQEVGQEAGQEVGQEAGQEVGHENHAKFYNHMVWLACPFDTHLSWLSVMKHAHTCSTAAHLTHLPLSSGTS